MCIATYILLTPSELLVGWNVAAGALVHNQDSWSPSPNHFLLGTRAPVFSSQNECASWPYEQEMGYDSYELSENAGRFISDTNFEGNLE